MNPSYERPSVVRHPLPVAAEGAARQLATPEFDEGGGVTSGCGGIGFAQHSRRAQRWESAPGRAFPLPFPNPSLHTPILDGKNRRVGMGRRLALYARHICRAVLAPPAQVLSGGQAGPPPPTVLPGLAAVLRGSLERRRPERRRPGSMKGERRRRTSRRTRKEEGALLRVSRPRNRIQKPADAPSSTGDRSLALGGGARVCGVGRAGRAREREEGASPGSVARTCHPCR